MVLLVAWSYSVPGLGGVANGLFPTAMNTSSATVEGPSPPGPLPLPLRSPDPRPSGETVAPPSAIDSRRSPSPLNLLPRPPLPPPAGASSSPSGLVVVIEKKPPPLPLAELRDRGPLTLRRPDVAPPPPPKRADKGPLPPPPTDSRPVKLRALLRNDSSLLLTVRGVAAAAVPVVPDEVAVIDRDGSAATAAVASSSARSLAAGEAEAAEAAVAAAAAVEAFCLLSPAAAFLLERERFALSVFRVEGRTRAGWL